MLNIKKHLQKCMLNWKQIATLISILISLCALFISFLGYKEGKKYTDLQIKNLLVSEFVVSKEPIIYANSTGFCNEFE